MSLEWANRVPQDVWVAAGVAAGLLACWMFVTGAVKLLVRVALIGAIVFAGWRIWVYLQH